MATKAIIKAELLTWTRNRAKVTLADAAKAVDVEVVDIERWEAGEDYPSLSQLRCLAAKYHYPLAVFYLPEPPADFAPLRDFRRIPNAQDRNISANLAFHIRTANERRELALELHEDLRDTVSGFTLQTNVSDDPEAVGQSIRTFLDVGAAAQRKAASQGRAFDFWRRKLEERGILVFVISGPHYSVELEEMRGFALAKDVLPVVVVNGKDYSQGGKCYTLLHELTHIMLRESGISNGTDFNSTSEEQRIERFCDAVAAAALMPRDLVLAFPDTRAVGVRRWSDEQLLTISRAVGVSREALLLRLVALNRATRNFYTTQRARYQHEYRQAAEEKALVEKKGLRIKRSIMLMSWNGRGYTRLVLRSYYDQRITLNDVSSYLGAKVRYIPALERAAFQRAE